MVFHDEYLLEIVSDYIILFNAVDMVLAKLQKHGLNININLAGIIIENVSKYLIKAFIYL